MNPHLQRALLLLEQSRHELAEQELRQSLAVSPNDAMAHAVLAICLAQRGSFSEASQEAEAGIHLAPEDAFMFYANSVVLRQRNHLDEAEQAIQQAIDLAPNRTQYFAQWAQLCFDQRRWDAALQAAEQGLELDPEDVECTNLRALSLVKLGRKTEAGEAITTALQRNPEDAFSHANMGWTLIEQGQHEKALEHFREALRLEPELEYARQGIVEALKARHFIYRAMLSYFLWMTKLSQQAQWGVILGGYLGYRILGTVARNNPNLAPWIMPLLVLYVVFAIMTWVAGPLFNLLLRLNRFGRLALSREQTIIANWVGLCVLGAFVSLAVYFGIGLGGALFAAMAFGFTIPPLSRIYDCDRGWPRTTMVLITIGLVAVGLLSAGMIAAADFLDGDAGREVGNLGTQLLFAFVLGAIGSQFAANALAMTTVRR